MTRNGALAGMVAGGVSVIVWANLDGGFFEVYEILPGFVISTFASVIVSLHGQPPVMGARLLDN
jgi:sodium/proline symporter